MSVVYDLEKLNTIVRNFNVITKIKIVVFDTEMKVIAAVPVDDCKFCSALSVSAEMKNLCHKSNSEGCLISKKNKGLNIYRCHAGLIEAVAPIFIGDIIVGYMMLGQILSDSNKDVTSNEIINYASKYIGRNTELYFSELVCKTDEEIIACAHIMKSLVCDILANGIIKKQDGKLIFDITKYIEEHLSEDLSVNALCEKFKISRNCLYHLVNTYLGMPAAEFVRKKRIEKASLLIKQGFPVTQVAETVGFYDYSYFGKVFKSITGKTPSDIKKSR